MSNIWQTKQWKEKRQEILTRRTCCEWCGSHKNLSIAHNDLDSVLTNEYLEMRDEDIQVLCKRCHFAQHHGKEICTDCHEHYFDPSYYSVCYACSCMNYDDRSGKYFMG